MEIVAFRRSHKRETETNNFKTKRTHLTMICVTSSNLLAVNQVHMGSQVAIANSGRIRW